MTRLQAMQQSQLTPQALQLSRHARRVYVGGLPANITEVTLTHFFNQVSAQALWLPQQEWQHSLMGVFAHCMACLHLP
jgi:hypothetical protein